MARLLDAVCRLRDGNPINSMRTTTVEELSRYARWSDEVHARMKGAVMAIARPDVDFPEEELQWLEEAVAQRKME